MKRELLSDIDSMSGTGWYYEDMSIECPICSYEINLSPNKSSRLKCPGCHIKLKIKYGKQYFWKIEEEE